MKRCVPLESAAEAVCKQSSLSPPIYRMPPEQGRKALEEIFQYILLRQGVEKSETRYSISMEQDGYLEAFIPMKS